MRLPEGLPELRGGWLTAYKVLWWAMLAASLIGLTAGQWRDMQTTSRLDRQFFGAGVQPDDGDEGLIFGPLGPEARAAGIVPGSELLAIDGRPVSSEPTGRNLERLGEALDGPAGDPVTLRLRAPDGTVVDVRVTRGPQHLAAGDREAPSTYAQRNLIVRASRTLDALIVLLGAILLFRRRAGDPVAALLSFGLLAVPANDLAFLFENPALVQLLASAFDVVPMACILLGMTVFPSGRFEPRWTLLIVPAVAAWTLLLLIGDEWPLPLVFAAFVPGLVIAVGSLVRRYVAMKPGTARQQVKWVMLGFAAFFVCGMVQTGLLLANEAIGDSRAQFAALVADNVLHVLQGASIVGGLLVALLRHRLYDADVAISRSAAYAGLTVTLIAVFAASETLIQTLGQQWFGPAVGTAGGAIAAALAALLLVPLHHRLSAWAERRFRGDLARLRAELPVVLAEIRNSADPGERADDALRLVMRGVHASRGAVMLAQDGDLTLLHAEDTAADGLAERLAGEVPKHCAPGMIRAGDPELPVRLPLVAPGGALVGWLALGPHPDGSLYGKDDRKTLEEVAAGLAKAVDRALERGRRKAEREADRRRLEEQVALLERKLAEIAVVGLPQRPGTA